LSGGSGWSALIVATGSSGTNYRGLGPELLMGSVESLLSSRVVLFIGVASRARDLKAHCAALKHPTIQHPRPQNATEGVS